MMINMIAETSNAWQIYGVSIFGGILLGVLVTRYYYIEYRMKSTVKDIIDLSVIRGNLTQLRGMVPILQRLIRDIENLTESLASDLGKTGNIEGAGND